MSARGEYLWNVQAEIRQLESRVRRLTEEDHRHSVVDNNGPGMLEALDALAAVLADAREKQRKALFDLGY